MKKYILLASLLSTFLLASAQQDPIQMRKDRIKLVKSEMAKQQAEIDRLKYEIDSLSPTIKWTKGAFTSLNFNGVGLNNWAAGGNQSNTVTLVANGFANYSYKNLSWTNNLDMSYGLVKNEGESIRKNEDKIDYLTKLGYKASKKFNYAFLGNLKTQFAPGFDFTDMEDPEMISKFLAPAFINVSVGMDYKMTSFFSIYFSPIAGKLTIVADDSIAAKNIYIPNTLDANGLQFYSDYYRAEFGLFLSMMLNKDFTKNVNLRSRVELFENYTDKNISNRKNIDVNWETTLNMRITKYIGTSLFTHLIYDNDIEVPTSYDIDGNPLTFGPRLQFKRVFGIGLSYKI